MTLKHLSRLKSVIGILFGFVCAGLLFSPLYAEDKKAEDPATAPYTMDEVVVTANPDPSLTVQSVGTARENMLRIPGGASVVASEDYTKGRATMLQDALAFTPGVYVQQRDSAAQESRISIRGSGIQRTFHLRGVKLLYDGIPLNQADGGGDAQRIEPLAIRYTEVYRGGNALKYGATTLGGAINFVSPTGYDADPWQGRFEIGSYKYIRSQVSTAYGAEPLDYYVSLSQFKQDGFREHAEQDNYNVFSNLGYKWTDLLESRLYVTYISAMSKLAGSLTKSQMMTNPRQANPANVSGNRKRNFDYWRVATKTTLEKDKQTFNFSFFWFTIDLFHPIHQVFDIISHDFGGELSFTDKNDRFGKKNNFTMGFIPTLGFIRDNRYTNVGGERGAQAAEARQAAYNLDYYLEDQFYLTEQFSLVGGAQLSYSSRDSDDFFFSNGDDSGHKVYRAANPKIGAIWELMKDARLFANYNRAFEPPSFSELFNAAGDFLPNKAQVSHTVEGGFRGENDFVEWDATYYHSWLDNELLSINDEFGNALGTINAPSETIHHGVEFGTRVNLVKDLVYVRGIYNWNDFQFNGDPVFTHNRLPSIPQHVYRGELMYEHPSGIYAGPNIEGTWDKYPIDMANTFFADPYMVWGFRAGYRAQNGPSFFVEGKNLSDEIYAASTGIVADARGIDNNSQFNPGVGRSWYGGVEYKW